MVLVGEAWAGAVEPESRRGRSELSVLPAGLKPRAPAERLLRPPLSFSCVFLCSLQEERGVSPSQVVKNDLLKT